MAKYFLSGDSRCVQRIAPKLHELLDDADPFGVRILGRSALAESPMAQSAKAQRTIRLEIAAHLLLRSGDDAGKEMRLAGGLERVRFLFSSAPMRAALALTAA